MDEPDAPDIFMTSTQELRTCAMVRRKMKEHMVGNEKCGARQFPFLTDGHARQHVCARDVAYLPNDRCCLHMSAKAKAQAQASDAS